MFMRIFFRKLSRAIPLWPLKALKKLAVTLIRGNGKYIVMMLLCATLIFLISSKQRIKLPEDDVLLYKDSVDIMGKKDVDITVQKILKHEKQNTKKLSSSSSEKNKPKQKLCSETTYLAGNLTINPNITPSFIDVQRKVGKSLIRGGCYHPLDCDFEQKVAIIIPFKDRDAHLRTLLYYLHPMLIKQKSYYCIYVAEQFDTGQFNKAMIMNAAFVEVMKMERYDCIIFHDVDMIPENDMNLYRCGSQPRHLSPAIDKFKYKPHYGTDFGGVTAITPAQYKRANGHSNEFWGWGGEDNDMEFRIRHNGMKIIPSPLDVGRYKMIVHIHPWKFKPGSFPFELNKTAEQRAHVDGLSDLRYRMLETTKNLCYTKMMIDIRKIDVKEITMFIDGKKAMSVDLPPEGKCRYVNYEGKYLQERIELTNYKEAEKFRPKMQDGDNFIPEHIRKKLPQAAIARFSFVENYADAEELCEMLQPTCQGIQLEINNKYTLRKAGVPRNLVVTMANKRILPGGKSILDQNAPKRYIFPAKNAYLRYCPGDSGSMQKYGSVIPVDLSKDSSKAQHTYGFEIKLSIILQPSSYMYYSDTKLIEGADKVHQNLYTFKWPNGGSAPNFNAPGAIKDFVFRTDDFSIPTIPGSYGVESKIMNGKMHPYFQWLWWFDVSSDDKAKDAEIRSEYRLEVSQARKINKKKQELKKNEKAQMLREYLFEKEMAFLRKKDFITNPNLERVDEVEYLKDKLNLVGKMPQFLLDAVVSS